MAEINHTKISILNGRFYVSLYNLIWIMETYDMPWKEWGMYY